MVIIWISLKWLRKGGALESIVPREYIEKNPEAAFYSPSSKNRKPWHCVVVKDRELMNF